MERRFRPLLAVAPALVLLASGPAGPAAALPFTGVLTLRTFGGFAAAQVGIPGGGDATVSTGGAASIPVSAFATSLTEPIPCCNARPLVNFELGDPAANAAGTLAPGEAPGGGFGGVLPLEGFLRFGLFGPPPFAFLTLPLQVGRSGTVSSSSPIGVTITVEGTPWTTGVVTRTVRPFGTAPVTFATMGTDLRTPDGLGRLVVVSPSLVRTNIGGLERVVLGARLDLTFVPEPTTALLLATGLAGLAVRRRGLD